MIPEKADEWCVATVHMPRHVVQKLYQRAEQAAVHRTPAEAQDPGTLPGYIRPNYWKFKASGRARVERGGLFVEIFTLAGETWPEGEKPQ